MRKLGLILALLLVCSVAKAQCVAEVKDVVIDNARGSIVVKTQYKLNDVVVDVRANPDPVAMGQTRYTEESGTIEEILAKAKEDIQQHCENLIVRNSANINDLKETQLNIVKSKTTPLLATLKTSAVGWKKTVSEKTITFKGKSINVKANGTYTVSDAVTDISK